MTNSPIWVHIVLCLLFIYLSSLHLIESVLFLMSLNLRHHNHHRHLLIVIDLNVSIHLMVIVGSIFHMTNICIILHIVHIIHNYLLFLLLREMVWIQLLLFFKLLIPILLVYHVRIIIIPIAPFISHLVICLCTFLREGRVKILKGIVIS